MVRSRPIVKTAGKAMGWKQEHFDTQELSMGRGC